MPIRLILDNQNVTIKGASPKTIRALEKVTSYLVAGYMFAPAFRARRWDGREHLMVFRRGRYQTPIGLLPVIRAELNNRKQAYVVKRRREAELPRADFTWNPEVKLRPYQRSAVKAFCSKPERGRGILKMPIRSGKTKTAAGIIRRLRTRTMFIVPSQMLLHQTAASLRESLLDVDVGMIGDGHHTEGEITVATIQSLARLRGGTKCQCEGNKLRDDSGCWIKPKHTEEAAACGRKRCTGSHNYVTKADPRWRGIIEGYGLVIFDECHHLRGDSWHKTMMDFRCRYRMGLSATAYLDSKKEQERGVIWLRGCCGDIKYEVSTSLLIEQGYLMRQHVELYTMTKPNKNGEGWSSELRDECVYENVHRNKKIVRLVKKKLDKGLNVMIVTNRLNQIAILSDLLDTAGIDHATVTGRDTSGTRADRVQMFSEGHVSVIIGTVFGEGIDIPEVEVVINAEGGKDMKATVQRMRNMTPSEGKTRSVLIDFMDATNKYFHEHSIARLATYEGEPAFVVKKMWLKKDSTTSHSSVRSTRG